MEFGIFNDEGLIEGGFISRESAEATVHEMYAEDDDLHVGEICHDHPDYEAATCEACAEEADDDFDEDEDFDDEGEL